MSDFHEMGERGTEGGHNACAPGFCASCCRITLIEPLRTMQNWTWRTRRGGRNVCAPGFCASYCQITLISPIGDAGLDVAYAPRGHNACAPRFCASCCQITLIESLRTMQDWTWRTRRGGRNVCAPGFCASYCQITLISPIGDAGLDVAYAPRGHNACAPGFCASH